MQHMDEVRKKAIAALKNALAGTDEDSRAVLIDDLFGQLRIVLWEGKSGRGSLKDRIVRELAASEILAPYWTGDIWLADSAHGADSAIYKKAWQEGSEIETGKLRLLDRHRTRGAWFTAMGDAPWVRTKVPPVVAFYSFKGGVGRSTALAAFAIRRARAGERVVVIDGDLDAPGVGTLLAADSTGTVSKWGVTDYLLEKPLMEIVDFRDYYHVCGRDNVTGKGEILVIPAGLVNESYLGKLARLDLELPLPGKGEHPLHVLLKEVQKELRPAWILMDLRSGMADAAGFWLGGGAHLHVLFGTFSEQSWNGLRLVIKRLGSDRIQKNKPQLDCLVVHALVPSSTNELFERASKEFADRSKDEFTECYYAEAGTDIFWTVEDAEGSDAPHVPIPIPYKEPLAYFSSIDEVANDLAKDEFYGELEERIMARFGGDPG